MQNETTKQEIGLHLYAITSMQSEPFPFLCQSAALDHSKFSACFLLSLLYSRFGLLKCEQVKEIIVSNMFHRHDDVIYS